MRAVDDLPPGSRPRFDGAGGYRRPMPTQLSAYLTFQGQAREAMDFYQDVFGGTIALNTYAEFGETGPQADQIMHAQLDSPVFTLMASDIPPGWEYSEGQRIRLILHGDDEAQLRGYWDKLADGGTVENPLSKEMWGDTYGALRDKFGIGWMMNISPAG